MHANAKLTPAGCRLLVERIPIALSLREPMARRLATKRGRRLPAQRCWTFESVVGDMRGSRGIRRFMGRGRAACAGNGQLITPTHNLRKLY